MIFRKRIVAVDDSNIVLKTLKNVLEEEGFEFHAFSTGTRILEYLTQKEEIPDLIILDIEMPIMSGYDILDQIKRIDHLNDVPVIFLTSNNKKEQVMKAVTGGIKDYVVKPINKEILLKKLYALLKDQLVDGEEESTEGSSENSTGESTESSTENSVEESTGNSSENSTEESTENSSESSAGEKTEDSSENSTENNEHDGDKETV